jgi:hypothetical protein
MNFILGVIAGIIVGVIGFYFVYKNNQKKIDAQIAELQNEVAKRVAITEVLVDKLKKLGGE